MIAVFKQNYFNVIVPSPGTSVIKEVNYQRITTPSPPASDILHIKNDQYSLYLPPSNTVDSVSLLHYKPTLNRLQYVKNHETVQQTDYDLFNIDWYDEVTITSKYKKDHNELLILFADFVVT